MPLVKHVNGIPLSENLARDLVNRNDLLALMDQARRICDQGFGNQVTYSKKVFIPLTHLCRDVCHYCTFAQTPKFIEKPYLSVAEVIQKVSQAEKLGCKEALFTLGERPEDRYQTAQDALNRMGFDNTIDYLCHIAEQVVEKTKVLPHINPGTLSLDECLKLRKVSASMGMMVESTAERLCKKGMPHYGSPDKMPQHRLQTLVNAGKAKIPFTTGILIGIGETRLERIESLLAIRDIHQQYGHIQEIIIQNFKAKPNTKMASAEEPTLSELLWTISSARLIFGPNMSIQAPPNLSPGVLPQLVQAGINDWGGVSPVTADFVNPEAPWPEIIDLQTQTEQAGKALLERLTIYPAYLRDRKQWLDESLHFSLMQKSDTSGWPRENNWQAGITQTIPKDFFNRSRIKPSKGIRQILDQHDIGKRLSQAAIEQLFGARDADFHAVCEYANELRKKICGDHVSYVVNRNINYTNICYFKCQFCAFSKGKTHADLRGKPYQISLEEIATRVKEAAARGATEVTLQGGIHPSYDGNTYLSICKTVKEACPDMHIHGFTPLEIWQGASTLSLSIEQYLIRLKEAGLGTIPGTAAEILSDEVRKDLCPDKINSAQWLEVMKTAHNLGIRSTATIMFGHIESPKHWAEHLIKIRDLQKQTGGFTELVPLPFVAESAPIFRKKRSHPGPTLRESLLIHAVSRIVLSGFINNIQASWVKLGKEGVDAALKIGANDIGGTLMNESITKAAGAKHGQEQSIFALEEIIANAERLPVLRNTLYQKIDKTILYDQFTVTESQPLHIKNTATNQ